MCTRTLTAREVKKYFVEVKMEGVVSSGMMLNGAEKRREEMTTVVTGFHTAVQDVIADGKGVRNEDFMTTDMED